MADFPTVGIRRWIELLLVAAASVVLGLAELGYPSTQFWRHNVPLIIPWLVLAGVANTEIVQAGVQERRLAREKRAREILRAALLRIHEQTRIDLYALGVHAFLVGLSWKHPVGRELIRIGRERLKGSPGPSGVAAHAWCK
jgi:hypothetical protein